MAHYLSCRIGREWYGISIEAVSEVLHIMALRRLPKSTMTGVMTLREKVIPVLDLRQVLGVEEYGYALDTPIIALQIGENRLGIIVDEADDVLNLSSESIQAYTDGFVIAMARLEKRLLFILNLDALMREQLEAQSHVEA